MHSSDAKTKGHQVINTYWDTLTPLAPRIFLNTGKRVLLVVKRGITMTEETRNVFFDKGLNFFGTSGRLFSRFYGQNRMRPQIETRRLDHPKPDTTMIVNIPLYVQQVDICKVLTDSLPSGVRLEASRLAVAPWTWTMEVSTPEGTTISLDQFATVKSTYHTIKVFPPKLSPKPLPTSTPSPTPTPAPALTPKPTQSPTNPPTPTPATHPPTPTPAVPPSPSTAVISGAPTTKELLNQVLSPSLLALISTITPSDTAQTTASDAEDTNGVIKF